MRRVRDSRPARSSAVALVRFLAVVGTAAVPHSALCVRRMAMRVATVSLWRRLVAWWHDWRERHEEEEDGPDT